MSRNQIHFDLTDEEYTEYSVFADRMGWTRGRLAAEIARNFIALSEEEMIAFLSTDVAKRVKKAKRNS
jgi:hypothetical protein